MLQTSCQPCSNLQGLPVAEDMRGDVIQDAIRPEVLKARPIHRTKTYEVSPRPAVWDTLLVDPELDRDTMEKLRNLGYLQSP